jgi:predicted GTPase
MIPNRQNISIAILGTVSAGKSTLLNNIFVSQYSNMKIKRTTMQPQVYFETDEISSKKKEIENIKIINSLFNKKLIEKTEKGDMLTINDISEINYYVPKVHKLINLQENVYLSIYDIPGLNDIKTKDVYFEYINNSFYKFDIIIFVLDVNHALNTSDEGHILEMILNNIKQNKEKYNIKNKLMILLNKCDEMFLKNNKLIMDDEHMEMLEQVQITLKQKVAEIHPETDYKIIPFSAEDSYIYRMYDRNPEADLDVKHVNKFGLNEFGKRLWNYLTDDEKKSKIKQIIKQLNLNETLTITGFNEFKSTLNKYLDLKSQKSFLLNHIKYDLSKIKMPETLIFDTTSIKNIYNKNIKLNITFKKKNLSNYIKEFFIKYWNYYNENLFDKELNIINDENYEKANNTLRFLKVIAAELPLINIIKNLQNTLIKNIQNYYIENINNNNKPFDKLFIFINNLLEENLTKEMIYKIFTNKDTLQFIDSQIITKLEYFENKNIIDSNDKKEIIYSFLLKRYKSIYNDIKINHISCISTYSFLAMKFWDNYYYKNISFHNIKNLSYWSYNIFKNMIDTVDTLNENITLDLEKYYKSIYN